MTESASERCPTCAKCNRPTYASRIRCTVCGKTFHLSCIITHGHDSAAPAAPHKLVRLIEEEMEADGMSEQEKDASVKKLGDAIDAAANTTTHALRGSEEKSETGRVKLSGVQDHADKAQVVGGESVPGPSVRPESRSDDTERKAFEAWVSETWGLSTEEYDLSFYTGLKSREYKDGTVNDMWNGWLARAAVTPVEEERKEFDTYCRSGLSGALWLCYHALKASEWKGYRCQSCRALKSEGHDKDCMVGNGMKAMAAVTRTEEE